LSPSRYRGANDLPAEVPGAGDAEKWNWFSYRPLATVVEGAKHLGDPNNPVLRMGPYCLHANKDFMLWKPRENATFRCGLGGGVVYAPKADDVKGRWFAPRKALDIMNRPLRGCKRM
jgi:hypothetical protein